MAEVCSCRPNADMQCCYPEYLWEIAAICSLHRLYVILHSQYCGSSRTELYIVAREMAGLVKKATTSRASDSHMARKITVFVL